MHQLLIVSIYEFEIDELKGKEKIKKTNGYLNRAKEFLLLLLSLIHWQISDSLQSQ